MPCNGITFTSDTGISLRNSCRRSQNIDSLNPTSRSTAGNTCKIYSLFSGSLPGGWSGIHFSVSLSFTGHGGQFCLQIAFGHCATRPGSFDFRQVDIVSFGDILRHRCGSNFDRVLAAGVTVRGWEGAVILGFCVLRQFLPRFENISDDCANRYNLIRLCLNSPQDA